MHLNPIHGEATRKEFDSDVSLMLTVRPESVQAKMVCTPYVIEQFAKIRNL